MPDPETVDRPRNVVDVHEFMTFVIRRIIEAPDALQVRVVEGDHAIVIEARVAESDTGRVIGRKGNTINSLRTLAGAIAARAGKRAMFDIVESPRQPDIK